MKTRLNDIDGVLIDMQISMKVVLSKLDNLPERIYAIELEKAKNDSYINNFVKPFFIFFIGMVSTYVFQNVIFAHKEEKDNTKTEVRK